MASQWIRWNNTTHIFEYSTDNGTSFAPLPLNASILTEGSIPDNRLSSNVVLEDVANVFTSQAPISINHNNPIIKFRELDAAVDQKSWQISIDNSLFRVLTVNDADNAFLATLLTLDRFGALNLTQNADHIIGGSAGASVNRVRIRNTVSGVDRIASLFFDTDVPALASLHGFTSGYASNVWNIAAGLTISCGGIGGVNIAAASGSGALRIYTGGATTPRLTINPAGDSIFSGTLTERGRATPVGDWINVPFTAADYTTNTTAVWAPDAGDLRTFRYNLIGKTMTIVFSFVTTSITGTPAPSQIRFKIPGGYTVAYQTTGFAQVYDAASGGWQIGCATANQGANYIILAKINLTTTFTVVADGIYVYGEITFEVA